MHDQIIIEGVRRARARLSALELDGSSARFRDLAVELLQVAAVTLEQALTRQEFEGVEASAHERAYASRVEAVGEALERALRVMKRDAAPRQRARVAHLEEMHPSARLVGAPIERLEEAVRQTRALIEELIPQSESYLNHLDGALSDVQRAHADFGRESAEFLDAHQALASTRDEVHVHILNARDIMRASLRSCDRLDELDVLLPPLRTLLGA